MSSNGKCGPLCQHPGCWEIPVLPKSHGAGKLYLTYMQKVILKRNAHPERSKRRANRGMLPSLTVQTLNDALPLSCNEQCKKDEASQKSPKARIDNSRWKNHQNQCKIEKVAFSQMVLEEESMDNGDYTITPVLIWRPGKRHVVLTVDNQDSEKPSTKRKLNITNLTDEIHLDTDCSVGKNPVPMKLKLQMTKSPKPLTDKDKFSYLKDIPPSLMAQMLEYLRSTSTVSIGNGYGLYLTTPSVSQKMGRNASKGVATPLDQPSHLPFSIVCDLMTQKVHGPTAACQHLVTSRGYSRMLAKRPLEVLRGSRKVLEHSVQESTCSMATTLTLPDLQHAVAGTGKSSHPPQLKYPHGNPLVPGQATRHHENKDAIHSLTEEACDGGQDRGLLEAPSARKAHTQPRAKPLTLIQGAKCITCLLQAPSCGEPAPPNTPMHGTCRKFGQQPSCVKDSQAVDSPDHMVTGAQLEQGHLLLLDSGGRVVHNTVHGESLNSSLHSSELGLKCVGNPPP